MFTLEDVEVEYADLKEILKAYESGKSVVSFTKLDKNEYFSHKYNAEVMFKREDLQIVRSYKIRGAYNKISSLGQRELTKGVVCASAGNHAQGVALSCKVLKVKSIIYMPVTTPQQKINRVKMLGDNFVEIRLVGDNFDQCSKQAKICSYENNLAYIAPFDDIKVIEGQATVGVELLKQTSNIDYLFVPIGGGGLASGVISVFKQLSPDTKIVGVEPEGAAGMFESLKQGRVVTLGKIDKFVDGAAVQRVGDLTYQICKSGLDDIIKIPEGKVCSTLLDLYNQEAIVVEPAGALSVAALDLYAEKLENKRAVCIISGGNNDVMRMEEIKERAMLYKGLKHFFIVSFPQRPGALKDFVVKVLGDNDNIVHFEYAKKTNRESGPALVGIEIAEHSDLQSLMSRMKKYGYFVEYVNNNKLLFEYIM